MTWDELVPQLVVGMIVKRTGTYKVKLDPIRGLYLENVELPSYIFVRGSNPSPNNWQIIFQPSIQNDVFALVSGRYADNQAHEKVIVDRIIKACSLKKEPENVSGTD